LVFRRLDLKITFVREDFLMATPFLRYAAQKAQVIERLYRPLPQMVSVSSKIVICSSDSNTKKTYFTKSGIDYMAKRFFDCSR